MSMCWECGATSSSPVTAMLPAVSGTPRRFRLCPTCYEDHYLPLLAESTALAERHRAHAAPPRPRRRAGQPHGQ